MYGKHVILVDTLTDESHDALVVGEQAAEVGGPKELLTLAYIRKAALAHAMHEDRILYRMHVRPAAHLEVKQGKVTHYYRVPDGSVGIGGDAVVEAKPMLFAVFLDGVQRSFPEPGTETIGIVGADDKLLEKALADIAENDVLAIGPYPQGSTVTSVSESDDSTMVNILATSNPMTAEQLAAIPAGNPAAGNSAPAAVAIDGVNNFPTREGDAGDPPQGGEAALAEQAAHDAATGNTGQVPADAAPATTEAEAVTQ